MRFRPMLVLLLAPCAVVFTAKAVDERVGDRATSPPAKSIQRPAPEFGSEIPLPIPELPSPTAIDVNVVNLPVDHMGHLVTCEHAGDPKQVEVLNPMRRFELVGFTTGTTPPTVGVYGLTRLCQVEFPGTRMCTLGEALDTVNVPNIFVADPNAAWTRDDLIVFDSGGTGSVSSCRGWSSTTGVGLVITTSGSVSVRSCTNEAHVACCAPIQ